MFDTKLLLPKEQIPSYDVPISRQLSRPSLSAGFGQEMVVGLETPSGDIYREVRTYGAGNYARLCLMLRKQGLRDRFSNQPGQGGYASRFMPR